MIHFWLVFFRGRKQWGWRVYAENRTGEAAAYRTKKEAKPALDAARKMYGEARLYKFKPDAFIFGASK